MKKLTLDLKDKTIVFQSTKCKNDENDVSYVLYCYNNYF